MSIVGLFFLFLEAFLVTVSGLASSSSQQQPITPCVRICRYNADCYDGAVCIGCFREAFEIGQWASLSAPEKSYALQDAADRWQPGYEGSVSRDELLRQAAVWADEDANTGDGEH